jgi:peptidoglycan/LPS O-acetylase OafA/YrhL
MFLPGIVSYQYTKIVTPKIPGWLWPLAMAVPIGAYVVFASNAVFLSWIPCLFLGLSIPHFKPLESKLTKAPAKVIARYSYGIYLTHLPCIFVSFGLMVHYPLQYRIAVFLILMSVSSGLLYHAIESPFLNFGGALAKKTIQFLPSSTSIGSAASAP